MKKSFHGRVAVDGVSFHLAPGEVLGLLGPNGAGKTTVIRSILRIYEPDEGRIVYGPDLVGPDAFGYLPEERGLYPDAPVLDCLVYLATLKGLSRKEARANAWKWLRRVDLTSWADKRVETLSKGMQQKVQFIASIIHRPVLAILDEVFSGLDPVNQELMVDLIRQLAADGTTLLISSHQIHLVESLCPRVVLIHRGKVVRQGQVGDLRRSAQTRRVHLVFSGSGEFIKTYPGVSVERWDQGEAVFTLESPSLNPFLEAIARHVHVTEIQVSWPSLHDIFVDVATSSEETVP